MGRVKLDIKKLENSSSRQATYSKRKQGILKKAEELATLCDIDLALVMFSPGGKPSFRCGKNGVEKVIAKYNQLPPHERTKKYVLNPEALKKTYKKSDHDVNIQDFIGTRYDLTDQAVKIQTRIAEIHERLRYWSNPDKVSDLELVMQMEDSLQKSLDQVQKAKENCQKRQRVSLESYTELPFHVSDQQLQQLLWTTSDEIPNTVLTSDQKLSTQREMDSCTGSACGSNFGCVGTGTKSEEFSPGQLSSTDNVAQCQDGFQGLQFDMQYPYQQHAFNMQGTTNNLQVMMGLDHKNYNPAFDVNGNYQPTVWPGTTNHLPLESPADSAFGYYLRYQKTAVPAPALPTIYERMTRDPSHIFFDNALNHHV
ncbi:agamous-like MADS-box protein AGL30 isoform X3 [Silene latifolia]|uniref:agamous-like MADS-box protein AGL30 isoform X3 n=1 Tax=Silene latifolia TaxID=37657 RepID=UPI003D776752